MKKSAYLFTLVAIMLLSSGALFQLNAQTTPPSDAPVIVIKTVSAGAKVSINMTAEQANTPAWVETAPNTFRQINVGTDWQNVDSVFVGSGQILKIYGNIKDFSCSSPYLRGPVLEVDASRNTALISLFCYSNQITNINVSGLSRLECLNCEGNKLSILNVSDLTRLQYLDCENNQLNTLDLSGNTLLQNLFCSRNQLTSINLNGLQSLEYLICAKNHLKHLDILTLSNLQKIDCEDNQLTELIVDSFNNIDEIKCGNNLLTELDLSKAKQLRSLYCFNNRFTTESLDRMYCTLTQWHSSNPGSLIITKKDVDEIILNSNGDNAISRGWKLMNWTQFPVTTQGKSACGVPSLINLPVIELTTNKSFLKLRLKSPTKSNIWIETSKNVFYETTIDTSWTDIEKMRIGDNQVKIYGHISGFDCSNDSIIILQFKGNKKLETLICHDNFLTTLKLNDLPALKEVWCYNNRFSTMELDNMYCALPARLASEKASMYVLNDLNNDDFAKVIATNASNANSKNWTLKLVNNQQQTIDTKGNYQCRQYDPPAGIPVIELTTAKPLTSVPLKMSAASADTPVWIEKDSNSFINFTIGQNLPEKAEIITSDANGKLKIRGAITDFNCYSDSVRGEITKLDLSKNPDLLSVNCSNNQITELKLDGMTKLQFLYCDINNLSSLKIKELTELKELSCSKNKIVSLVIEEGHKNISKIVCNRNALRYLYLKNIKTLKYVNCSANSIRNLTVKYLPELEYLDCKFNDLVILNLIDLPSLTYLDCSEAHVPNLTFDGVGSLRTLICRANGIKNIDFKAISGLEYLDCSMNSFTSIDFSPLTALKELRSNYNHYLPTLQIADLRSLQVLHCQSNDMLSTIVLTGLTSLKELNCSRNRSPILSLTGLDSLEALTCSFCNLNYLEVSALTRLKHLNCSNNSISNLDIKDLTQLEYLNCGINNLTSLDILNLTNLKVLCCNENKITGLRLDHLSKLRSFYCGGNKITELSFTALKQLEILECANNPLTELIIKDLPKLEHILCKNSLITKLELSNLQSLSILDFNNNYQLAIWRMDRVPLLKFIDCISSVRTTELLDDIYCQLPERLAEDYAKIYITRRPGDTPEDYILASNGANANKKNWLLVSDAFRAQPVVDKTYGKHVCKSSVDEILYTSSFFTLSPNPAYDKIKVNISPKMPAPKQLSIFNLAGEEVYKVDAPASDLSIDLSNWTAGVYFINIDGVSQKFIVEHK